MKKYLQQIASKYRFEQIKKPIVPFGIIIAVVLVSGGWYLLGHSNVLFNSNSSNINNSSFNLQQLSSGLVEVARLWETGVDGDHNKLQAGQNDPHWTLSQVYNPVSGVNPCQTGTFPRAATTIIETSKGVGYKDTWKRRVDNARWIGQNSIGRNDSSKSCPDPTDPKYNKSMENVSDDQRMPYANIYVFELNDGFTIGNNIDLSTVKITLRGAVDNGILFVVNGTPLGDYQYPGFGDQNSSVTVSSDSSSVAFRYGTNSLKIYVKSTYHMTGILIDLLQVVGRPAYNYSLIPSITTNSGSIVDSNAVITLNPSVSNEIKTNPTASKDTNWRVTEVVYKNGRTVPNDLLSNSTYSDAMPCPDSSYFNVNDGCRNVTNVSDKTGNTIFNADGTWQSGDRLDTTVDLSDYDIGTVICYAYSIQPNKATPSGDDNRWRHSPFVCLTIGKKPKFQVMGGDLNTSKNVNTSQTTKNISGTTSTFGSWSEYGLLAGGVVSGMGSGSSLSPVQLSPLIGMRSYDKLGAAPLTFNNVNVSNNCTVGGASGIGCYGRTGLLDVESNYPGGDELTNQHFSPSGFLSGKTGTMVYDAVDRDVLLDGSMLDRSQSLILKTSGTITIAGNQTYANGPYTSISQLPQLVLIASKIVIDDSVRQVDAWLVATRGDGIIETCDTGSTDYALTGDERLTNKKCNQLLTVNGPVIARQLWLRRTSGSEEGNKSADPAEVFNLRADTYFWSISQSSSNNQAYSVRTVELPPRY